VIDGRQGHFSDTEVKPLWLEPIPSIMGIMHWRLPSLREQGVLLPP